MKAIDKLSPIKINPIRQAFLIFLPSLTLQISLLELESRILNLPFILSKYGKP
jgi:hypothetical protein